MKRPSGFLLMPLLTTTTTWWKQEQRVPFFCTSPWDCPRYQYCHVIVGEIGVCREVPRKPVWVPIPVPVKEEPLHKQQ